MYALLVSLSPLSLQADIEVSHKDVLKRGMDYLCLGDAAAVLGVNLGQVPFGTQMFILLSELQVRGLMRLG